MFNDFLAGLPSSHRGESSNAAYVTGYVHYMLFVLLRGVSDQARQFSGPRDSTSRYTMPTTANSTGGSHSGMQ